jgi:hypothetical protein
MRSIALVDASGMGGEIGEVARTAMAILKEVAPDADAISAAVRLAKEQGDTTNKLTSDMNAAAIAAKDLAIALQQVTLNLLPKAAELNKATLETFKSYIDSLFANKPTPPEREPATANPLLAPRQPSETVEKFQKRAQDLRDTQDNLNRIGKANGGISRGPVSGYSEILHGTEAVVPLPDNRSIPVSLDSSSITAAVNQQSGILAEILRTMQNNNSLTSQIAMNTV